MKSRGAEAAPMPIPPPRHASRGSSPAPAREGRRAARESELDIVSIESEIIAESGISLRVRCALGHQSSSRGMDHAAWYT